MPQRAPALPFASPSLLGPDDPFPVRHARTGSGGALLIVIDHAGRHVPRALGGGAVGDAPGGLGLPAAEFDRHIAYDIGVAEVGERLGAALDAETIAQAYSRLVVDCNRRPGHPTFIAPRSDGTDIPANRDLSPAGAQARKREIWAPYHDAIAASLDRRQRTGQRSVVFALHSFTPVMGGVARPWHVGLLYNRAPALAAALRARIAQSDPELVIGDNEPYRLGDDSDYTVPVHAEARGLPCVEIEIRQDLIADAAGQTWWAGRLAGWLSEAAG